MYGHYDSSNFFGIAAAVPRHDTHFLSQGKRKKGETAPFLTDNSNDVVSLFMFMFTSFFSVHHYFIAKKTMYVTLFTF